MKKKIKKIISTAMASSMALSALIIPRAQADSADPVIKVDFDTQGNYSLKGGAALADGRNGKALSLDGSDDYATVTGADAIMKGITGDYSISVWFNADTTATWSRVYDLGANTDNYAFLTATSGSGPRYAVKAGTEQYVDSAASFTTGAWHNVVIVSDSGSTKFYLDGFLQGETTAITHKLSDVSSYANMYLGKSQWPDPYFDGMIDDFEVYNYAVSEDKVHSLAGEVYENIKKETVLKNNCYVIDTKFYNGEGEELFSYDTEQSGGLYVTNIDTSQNDSVTFTLGNISDNIDTLNKLTAYVAQYDENLSLAEVAVKKISEIEGLDTTQNTSNITIDYTKAATTEKVKLFLWDDMKPVKSGDITVSVTAENDTAQNGEVSFGLYAVSDSGTETLLDNAALSLNSLESGDVNMTFSRDDIPDNTAKIIVKETADNSTNEAAALYCGIKSPVKAPADSNDTTNGAHDPSIVKFPGDDNYYVYSSHHLIFKSSDLINWQKFDFTNINAKDISPKTYSFISSNYSNTTMNGTYWAPDVIYREGDDHPYWMYISVSCGLGGRNSAISLMKSDNPLFWADKSSDIIDAGVVFATKEVSGYKTNAIDANIYTDPADSNKQYFVWGSFWGGIQAAPMTDDGFVQGIDYTSDSTILSSCKGFGTTIYTQKYTAAGPEGGWMLNGENYRYAFSSYGWLGSNYNTRIARSPLTTKFSENMGSQLVDADNKAVGLSSSSGVSSPLTGYKLIGSYRLGDGSYTLSGNNSDGYSIPRGANDAHIYYGPGHNSAIKGADGNYYYVSHTRKDATEIAATLQVRKMLFTSDGWPVVSPVTYAGEVEQKLPKEMIAGTYDLASVGYTKMNGSTVGARNFDLPVVSSKVTLNADGTLGNDLGTWTFDNDHTVTITFAKDGNTDKDEFYKSGDVMTMYALLSYDKDEKRPVMALTGVDQKHITQFAVKSMENSYHTPSKTIETVPMSIEKSEGGNPELGFDTDGSILYAGDPAATVIDEDGDGEGDAVYLIAGHDTAKNESYVMPDWVCYRSEDMKNWEYKGSVMSASSISWASNTTSAWASQMTPYTKNGVTKYYLYFCTWDKTSQGKQSIGVAVADRPEGPYTDALGKPLVQGSFTAPESASHDDIDPTVLIDKDSLGEEHRYLAWGNTRYYVCELNEDMTSVKDLDNDNEIVMHKDIVEKKIKSLGSNTYTEAPWLYKRNDNYYLFFAANWREEMAYAMTSDPITGRYDYKQTIMPPSATANTNHPSVIDFKDKTYFIYHNGALPHGSGFRRSVCVQELTFDEDGYVYPLTETSIGLDGKASVIKTEDNKYLGHNTFTNPLSDASYPISQPITAKNEEQGYDTAWEIKAAKFVPQDENADYYVSIQSVNKPGLYIKALDNSALLTQDADGTQGKAMTFKTVKGISDAENGVSFESVMYPNHFLTMTSSGLALSTTGENATFYIGAATAKDSVAINVAEEEPAPVAAEDITNDFSSATVGDVITLSTADQTNTSLAGAKLCVGSRGSGGSTSTGWAIESASGVDSSKALVMKCGRWASSSRGPRIQLITPPLPQFTVVTATFKVKLGDGGELYYGDSLGTQATNNITDKLSTTNWTAIRVSIETNMTELHTRKMYIGDSDTPVFTDYVDSFPVFWGKPCDDSSNTYKVYFDDVNISTIDIN